MRLALNLACTSALSSVLPHKCYSDYSFCSISQFQIHNVGTLISLIFCLQTAFLWAAMANLCHSRQLQQRRSCSPNLQLWNKINWQIYSDQHFYVSHLHAMYWLRCYHALELSPFQQKGDEASSHASKDFGPWLKKSSTELLIPYI